MKLFWWKVISFSYIFLQYYSFSLKFPSFSFSPELSINDFRLSIQGKTLIFLGDSVTRYQYLNLIYFIENGQWAQSFHTKYSNNVYNGNICCEKSYSSWERFYNQTNEGLNGNELCDCWKYKDDVIENRRYYNSKYKTHVIFVWYGRSPIYMRNSFTSYPYHILCPPGNLDCFPNLTATYDTFTIGSILENVTHSFQPDLVLLNWGHHHTYYTNTKGGKWVYDDLTSVLKRLKVLYKTRFIFKKTTPVCHPQVVDLEDRILQCSFKNEDSYNSELLCMKMISEKYLENFDIHLYIRLLSNGLASLHKPPFELTNSTPVEDACPLYWDRLHPHCWVMTEINRMLLATYFTSSTFFGLSD